MNIALWVVQGILALVFFMAGIMKVTQPKDKIGETMAWVNDFSQAQLRAIGALEVLGAIGLIVPGITGVAPVLVPLAALGIALTMIGAIVVHARRSEGSEIVKNVVFLAMAVFVAWGRFGDYPL